MQRRHVLPFAGLRLEPRQRPFPARRGARAAGARPRGRASTSRRTRWSRREPDARARRRRRSRRSRARYPGAAVRTLRPGDARSRCGAATAPTLVLVHEWNEPALVARARRAPARAAAGYTLLFHDTHHRAVTDPTAMAAYDLTDYDGVLAFGDVLARRATSRHGWAQRAWTWHEAADTRVFRPRAGREPRDGDLVWIGNWGDDERSAELHEFLLEPVASSACTRGVHGVRYPEQARASLGRAGIAYGGWLPNHRVPEVFAALRVTVHVPRRPYVAALPGIPTIRVFEALACGIPLVSAPWDDGEGLFTPGEDFLCRRDGAEMEQHLRDAARAIRRSRAQLAAQGAGRSPARHTCAHRVDELLAICANRSAHRRASASCAAPRASHEDRLLRLEPGVGLLERRRHLLSRHPARRCTAAATTSPSTSPTPSTASSIATSTDPDWAQVVVYPATATDGVHAALDAAADADVVVKASGVGVFDDAARGARAATLRRPEALVVFWDVDAPATLDRVAGGSRPIRFARADAPATTWCSPTAAATRSSDAYRALGAGCACRSTTRSIPTRTSRCRRIPGSPPISRFLGNRLPDREARVEEFFLEAAAHAAGAALPARRQRLGRQAAAAERALCRPRLHARPQRVQLHAAAVLNVNRDSMARYGFSPATRVFEAAGAAPASSPTPGRASSCSSSPDARSWWPRTATRSPRTCDRLTPARARAHRRGRARRACSREHTYAHACRAGIDACCSTALRPQAGGLQRMTDRLCARRPRPVDHLVLGQRPRHHLPRAAARDCRAAATTCCSSSATCPGMPRTATCRPAARREPCSTRSLDELRDALRQPTSASRRGDRRLVCAGRCRGRRLGAARRRAASTAFYDIDTPVTLAKLAAATYEYLAPRPDRRASTCISRSPAARRSTGSSRQFGRRARVPLYCSVDPELLLPGRRG